MEFEGLQDSSGLGKLNTSESMTMPDVGTSAASPYMSQNASISPQVSQGFPSKDAASLAGTAGAGALAGGPAGAGIMVGCQLASKYLAQKAADERAKRERSAQIEQNYGQDQQRSLGQMQQALMGAFR
jgi:hypothetical protein